jgi:hypothetical protein
MEERLDLARPENTLRKLLTAIVFYKTFGQIGDDQQGGEKLHSRVKEKKKACDQNVNLLNKRKETHGAMESARRPAFFRFVGLTRTQLDSGVRQGQPWWTQEGLCTL